MGKSIVSLAERFYEIVNSEGDLSEVFSNDFQFDIMTGFPYGGLQDGLEATNKFFEKLGPLFEKFEVHAVEFLPIDEGNLVVKGFYRAHIAHTDRDVDLETVHLWKSDGSKLTHYKHYCDTALLSAALDHKIPQ